MLGSILTIVSKQIGKLRIIHKNMKTNGDKVSEWLKKQVEKKFASDMGYKTVNCWLSPDRPQADVVVECIDEKNEKLMYRFIVVS